MSEKLNKLLMAHIYHHCFAVARNIVCCHVSDALTYCTYDQKCLYYSRPHEIYSSWHKVVFTPGLAHTVWKLIYGKTIGNDGRYPLFNSIRYCFDIWTFFDININIFVIYRLTDIRISKITKFTFSTPPPSIPFLPTGKRSQTQQYRNNQYFSTVSILFIQTLVSTV